MHFLHSASAVVVLVVYLRNWCFVSLVGHRIIFAVKRYGFHTFYLKVVSGVSVPPRFGASGGLLGACSQPPGCLLSVSEVLPGGLLGSSCVPLPPADAVHDVSSVISPP